MTLDKRQFSYGWYDNSTGYYWKEWVIFAFILVALLTFVFVARAMGKKRIARNQPLQAWHKFLFPKRFRNGPPYLAASTVTYNPSAGGHNAFGTSSGIAPPPPSYDPYATNLPPYQPTSKANGDHPEYEMVYTAQPVQGDYGRPGSSSAAVAPRLSPSQPPMTR